MVKIKFQIVFIFLLSVGSISNASVKKNTDELKYQEIKLIIDSTRTLNITQVEQKQNEAKSIPSQFIIPSLEFDYWFIIDYKNPENIQLDRYLGFDIACLEKVDLYYRDSTEWICRKNGLLIPIEDREFNSRLPIFKVTFNPHEEKTIYLHVHSKYLVPTQVENKTITSFRKADNKFLFAYWFYFGAAVSFLLYNLLLYFQLRDRVYLYYVFYVFFLLIWISLDSGLFLFISSNIKFYYFLSIGAPTMGFFLTMFTREILQIRKVNKWMDNALIIISFSYLILAVLVGINVYFYQFLGLIAMPFLLFLLYVGVYGIIKKIPLSKFYVIASSLYILGLFSFAGLTIGVIPYTTMTRHGFILGSFFELILFSLALGYRIKLLQAEKLRFQNKIIENERTMSRKLENKVKERTEKLLATSEQLENANVNLQKSNNAKDKLFSIISHDLRSPFNNLLCISELLTKNIRTYDIDKIEKFVNGLNISARNANNLLDDLLQWAGAQQGSIPFKPQNLGLTDICTDVLITLNPIADAKNIVINNLVEDHLNVFADADMLKTVLRNLVSNAIKFTNSDGSININAEPDSENVTISVSDNGIGISTDNLVKLFDISEVLTTKGTANETGTGLGLLLCKDFVEKHGGIIWVESEVGKGSEFRYTLPCNAEPKLI